ncbi:hypothetical protein NP233_g11828 [Leucocoprinus birnbaumii]|uniref:Major facilitator superfamily (MFS) profile domain-containing protein n=1 Tax=Leucocoprinus birnbaumii TaxID=56174 RepID=A0AAD5VFT5_9AGAR|nr:hypothetical protein NP233_g11828 [Leucocoprinus birnbaumii]
MHPDTKSEGQVDEKYEIDVDVSYLEASSREINESAKPTPDGGLRAWGVVLGSLLVQFSCSGYVCSYGVFQAITRLLHKDIHDRLLSVSYLLDWEYVPIPDVTNGPSQRQAIRPRLLAFICQGFGVGLGGGMMYIPSQAVISQYFDKMLPMALSIVLSGVSFGAILTPIIINNLLEKANLPFATATRIHAGFTTSILIIACMLVRPRIPPPNVHVNVFACLKRLTKDKLYVTLTGGFFFFGLGLFFPIFYLQLAATTHGLSKEFAFYSLVILNGCACAGSFICAFVSRKVRADYVTIFSAIGCSIICYAFASVGTPASIVLIGVIYGLSYGVIISILTPLVSLVNDEPKELGFRLGIAYACAGVAELAGPPIMGALLSGYKWWRPATFAGLRYPIPPFHRKMSRRSSTLSQEGSRETEKFSQDTPTEVVPSDDSKHHTNTSDERTPNTHDNFPDGGLRAWIVVMGSIFIASASLIPGVSSKPIIKKIFFIRNHHQLLLGLVRYKFAMKYSLVFFPGLIVGRLFDLGYFRPLFIVSGVFLVVATFLAAQCTEYWELLLSQGILAGIGCGGLFTCSNSIIAHWFKKKRGRALGYMAIGSALAGTTIPIIVKNLLPIVGFRWTMRTLGFIFLFTVVVCNATMKPRLPPVNVKGGLFNFAVFKDISYTLYCLSVFFAFLGSYTVMTYISTSAAQVKTISPDLAFYFVSFANGSSLIGRWMSGMLADSIGPLNVMAPASLIVGITTYAWPFARSTASLVVISVLYGFSIGAFVSLLPKPAMNFGGEGDVGRRVGMFLTIAAFAVLAGPPISGAIERKTGNFEDMGYFAGSAIMLGTSIMLVCRYVVLGKWIGKV